MTFSYRSAQHIADPARWVRFARQAIREDADVQVLIDGERGSGKSTFALQLARFLDADFGMDQVAFDTREAVRIASRLKPGGVVLVDESRRGGNRRRAMSSANVDTTDFIAFARKLNLIWLWLDPNAWRLDPGILENAHFRFHIEDRGIAVCHFNTSMGTGRSKPYWARQFAWPFHSIEGTDLWTQYRAKAGDWVRNEASTSTASIKTLDDEAREKFAILQEIRRRRGPMVRPLAREVARRYGPKE